MTALEASDDPWIPANDGSDGVRCASGNTSTSGGGIYNYGTLTLTNVTMNGNGAYDGGAIQNSFATMTLTNVTLANNGGTDSSLPTFTAFGAAIDNLNGTANLTNVTIAGNVAYTYGGGIFNEQVGSSYPAVLNLKNVLLANNSPRNCDFGGVPPTSSAGNLSTDASCGFGSGGDSVSVLLGPLETNGGYTMSQRLLPASAAINHGVNTGAAATDQRGITRPQGGMTDVGAVEFVSCAGIPTTKPTLVGPASGSALKTTQPLLDWAGPDCATSFKVIVRRGSPTGTIVFNRQVFPASQIKTSALARSRTYYWQVKACDAAGCLYGDQWSFRVN